MRRLLPVIIVLSWPSLALAILGCLHDERDLSRRATVVAIVTIESTGKVKVAACPEVKPQPMREPTLTRDFSAYAECGEVGTLKAKVKSVLRGDVSGTIEVLVGAPGPLVLGPCDDRPELSKMAGLQAVLYLRRNGSRWWTIDGPDSIYTSWPQTKLNPEFIARVSQLVAEPTSAQ